MAQDSYDIQPAVGLAGLKYGVEAGLGLSREAASAFNFGVALTEGAVAGTCKPVDASGQAVIGFAQRNHDHTTENSAEQVKDGDMAVVMAQGMMWVVAEDTLAAGDKVFVRHTAAGAEVLGSVRSDADSGDAEELAGARVLKGAAAGELAVITLNLP